MKWIRWTEAVKQFAMNRSKNDDVVEELEVSFSSDYDGAVLKAVQWWLRVWQFGQLADMVAIRRLGSSDHDRADFRAVQWWLRVRHSANSLTLWAYIIDLNDQLRSFILIFVTRQLRSTMFPQRGSLNGDCRAAFRVMIDGCVCEFSWVSDMVSLYHKL